jgi:hypothetical protein
VEYTPVLSSYLTVSPPDVEGVAAWVRRFENTSSIIRLTGTIPIRVNERDFEILVVDRDGRLLAFTKSALISDDDVGSVLNVQSITGLADPLQAAPSGNEDPEQLYAVVKS